MTLSTLLLTAAFAQAVDPDRPHVPSAGLAVENGPGALWVNPANLAYDPDPRWGVLVATDVGDPRTSIAATAGVGAFSVGVHDLIRADGAADWTLDQASALRLPERLAVGWRAGWHLVEGGDNFVAWDVGVSWRPLPWLGASAVARNIGSPDPAAVARSGGGLALRPFGDALVLGADYLHAFVPEGTDEHYRLTARVRPIEGLYLRGAVDSRRTVTLGVEMFFGGAGVGAAAVARPDEIGTLAWIGTDEPGESLVRSGRRVKTLDLRDAPPYQPATGLLAPRDVSWLDTMELLRRVQEDRGVRGVVLTLGDTDLSWARLQELRDRVVSLEEADKRVVVHLTGQPGTGAYYVASAASRVALHPASGLDLLGISAGSVHVRGALDLLGIEPDFVRRAEYKSAVETFTRTAPSAEALEQTGALLDVLEAEIVTAVADGRGVPEATVREWVDGAPWPSGEALARGMVDVLAYGDEVELALEDVHGGPVRVGRLEDAPQPRSAWESPSEIAVVYVESVIVPGESSPGGLFGARTAGSETIVEHLRLAREDPQVKAVVLRVDSPGGSSWASDEIWRAVGAVREAGKPVVASFGGVAASGGYYVATGADAIWAEPTTITGSIGVFSGKMDLSGMLGRLGITSTTLRRGRSADLYSPLRGWDPVQRARMQAQVDAIYAQFTERVATGRGLTQEEVEQVARGRVWSGRDAHEVGLVDGLGGLQDALADARERAGLRGKVAVVTYTRGGFVSETLAPAVVLSFARPRAEVPPVLAEALRPLVLWSVLGDGPQLLDPSWIGVVPP